MIARQRAILILLFAVFALPPLLSWFLFNYTDMGRESDTGGHGTLVVPPRPVPDWPLVDKAGNTEAERRVHGKWTLVYLLDYPGQLVLFPENMDAGSLESLFKLGTDDRPFIQERLYLIDPLGNLMMSYAAETAPKGIIKDLTRLLKYSRIG